MFARRVVVSAAVLGLPAMATDAFAQSSKKDSTQSSGQMSGMPGLALLSPASSGGQRTAHWGCVGVCARAQSVTPLGVPDGSPAFTVASSGSAVSAEGAARAGLAWTGAVMGDRAVMNAGGAADWRPSRSQPSEPQDDDGTSLSEAHVAGSAGASDREASDPGASGERGFGRFAPALLTTAAVAGAGVMLMSNGGGDDAPPPPSDQQARFIQTRAPTLTMNGPAVQPATGGPVNQVAVPEPGSLALMMTGLAALGLRRRRGR